MDEKLPLGFVVHKSHKTFYDTPSGARGYNQPRLRCRCCRKTGLGLKFACKKATEIQPVQPPSSQLNETAENATAIAVAL